MRWGATYIETSWVSGGAGRTKDLHYKLFGYKQYHTPLVQASHSKGKRGTGSARKQGQDPRQVGWSQAHHSKTLHITHPSTGHEGGCKSSYLHYLRRRKKIKLCYSSCADTLVSHPSAVPCNGGSGWHFGFNNYSLHMIHFWNP